MTNVFFCPKCKEGMWAVWNRDGYYILQCLHCWYEPKVKITIEEEE